MNRNPWILFFCLLFVANHSFAQSDAYAGTWKMEAPAENGYSPVFAQLQIALPEKNVLYPAHLTIRCDSFSADYELLLVKKSIRQLAISRNKYPVYENPFNLGKWPVLMNGIFDHSRDLSGGSMLSIMRMDARQAEGSETDTLRIEKQYRKTAQRLKNFFRDDDIQLRKINDIPWRNDEAIDEILSPQISPAYFSLLDTIFISQRDGVINLTDSKKTGGDVVSAALNGIKFVDQVELNKRKEQVDDIVLDTGLNILTFFADNFANDLPNRGRANLQFSKKRFSLDFANRADSGATFIAAKVFYDRDKSEDKEFTPYNPMLDEEADTLKPGDKILGGIISTSRQLTFAIWDDAVEDGDSISININGKWIARGFPVKKRTQYLTVTLEPGPNTITFIADNLGSIPPNTSVLEIIDGKKRKSFFIETDLGQNNLIKIYYDLKAQPD